MKKLILMIQFLTRIPIYVQGNVEDDEFRDGIIYFPLVGLFIGMLVVSSYYAAYKLSTNFLAAVTAVGVEAFVTGGLHLDGLGDTFDGVYSNRPKDRILDIMKDSRLGTNGALAILFAVLLKIALIQSFSIPHVYPILLLMPVFSRLAIVVAARFSRYARVSGMGNIFIGKVHNRHLLKATFISMILSLVFVQALPFLFVSYGFSICYIRHITGKIGGMTGDTLGALCELTELIYLLYFTIIFS